MSLIVVGRQRWQKLRASMSPPCRRYSSPAKYAEEFQNKERTQPDSQLELRLLPEQEIKPPVQ
jgi:hypothetical protein